MDEGGHHAGLMLTLHRSVTPPSELTCVSMAEMSQNPFSFFTGQLQIPCEKNTTDYLF